MAWHGLGRPCGQLGTAVPAVSSPNLLATRWRGGVGEKRCSAVRRTSLSYQSTLFPWQAQSTAPPYQPLWRKFNSVPVKPSTTFMRNTGAIHEPQPHQKRKPYAVNQVARQIDSTQSPRSFPSFSPSLFILLRLSLMSTRSKFCFQELSRWQRKSIPPAQHLVPSTNALPTPFHEPHRGCPRDQGQLLTLIRNKSKVYVCFYKKRG